MVFYILHPPIQNTSTPNTLSEMKRKNNIKNHEYSYEHLSNIKN